MGITNYAQEAFRSDSTDRLLFTPVPKFRFEVVMSITGSPDKFLNRIKSVNLPDISFDTTVANQYNKKRIIQTRMNYGDCTLSFYDTNDNWFSENVYLPYIANYYNTGKGISSTATNTDPFVQETDQSVSDADSFSTEMGYVLVSNENRYKIPKVVIYTGGISPTEGGAAKKRATVLRNCVIKSMNQESLDYSDSNPMMFTIVMQPEYVYIANNQTGGVDFSKDG